MPSGHGRHGRTMCRRNGRGLADRDHDRTRKIVGHMVGRAWKTAPRSPPPLCGRCSRPCRRRPRRVRPLGAHHAAGISAAASPAAASPATGAPTRADARFSLPPPPCIHPARGMVVRPAVPSTPEAGRQQSAVPARRARFSPRRFRRTATPTRQRPCCGWPRALPPSGRAWRAEEEGLPPQRCLRCVPPTLPCRPASGGPAATRRRSCQRSPLALPGVSSRPPPIRTGQRPHLSACGSIRWGPALAAGVADAVAPGGGPHSHG